MKKEPNITEHQAREIVEKMGRREPYTSKSIDDFYRSIGLEPEEPEQPSDPEEEIRALLLKKYRKNLEDPKGIERAIRALMRRGYAYGDIRSVLKQLAEEE